MQVRRRFCFSISQQLVRCMTLPHLIETLAAYQARDPAARSKLEVFLLYPGVHATINHRIAHFL